MRVVPVTPSGRTAREHGFGGKSAARSEAKADGWGQPGHLDALGRRVARTQNGVTTRYVYSNQLRIVAQLDDAGNVVSRFYYAGGINVPAFMVRGGNTYRIVTDHLGSPREIVDVATGAVVFAATYDAWGQRTVTVGSEDFVPMGFAGGVYAMPTNKSSARSM